MKDDYSTNSNYVTYTFSLQKVGRMYFMNLEAKGSMDGIIRHHSSCTHPSLPQFQSPRWRLTRSARSRNSPSTPALQAIFERFYHFEMPWTLGTSKLESSLNQLTHPELICQVHGICGLPNRRTHSLTHYQQARWFSIVPLQPQSG